MVCICKREAFNNRQQMTRPTNEHTNDSYLTSPIYFQLLKIYFELGMKVVVS